MKEGTLRDMGLEYFSTFAVQGPRQLQHCYNILLGLTKRALSTLCAADCRLWKIPSRRRSHLAGFVML